MIQIYFLIIIAVKRSIIISFNFNNLLSDIFIILFVLLRDTRKGNHARDVAKLPIQDAVLTIFLK